MVNFSLWLVRLTNIAKGYIFRLKQVGPCHFKRGQMTRATHGALGVTPPLLYPPGSETPSTYPKASHLRTRGAPSGDTTSLLGKGDEYL
ncbi:hypothetical protein AVEN_48926-1 [Araneus ventricosus]|uniref:Uncharacterized protein n=1 Tax=Araneus ventricosus TaxID=182803 RepID=A0A4Y2AI29_ARAVE|nr:hypothetical protein AVEN_48926-1 [Araneus ventricosus]